MIKRYFRHADSRVSTRTLGDVAGPFGFAVHAPEGVEEIPAEEGEKLLAALQEQRDGWVAAQREVHTANREADYQVLIGLGVPQETARRLSGYHGG